MSNRAPLKIALAIGASFMGFGGIIFVLWGKYIITTQLAKLLLIALLGFYLGFGILIATYRLVNKLE